jgi:hypothetical protein
MPRELAEEREVLGLAKASPRPRVASLGVLLIGRVRVSLRREWSKPLHEAEGVHIATEGWILWREFGPQTPLFNMLTAALGLAFVVALALLRGSSHELLLVMCIGPICLALLMTDPVARMLAFYLAVRRWEAQNKRKLSVPRLTPRRQQVSVERSARKREGRSRRR